MPNPVEASRPLMPTRPLMLVFASAFGISTAFYLLLSVVPLYAVLHRLYVTANAIRCNTQQAGEKKPA
jgi:hypothetical protein